MISTLLTTIIGVIYLLSLVYGIYFYYISIPLDKNFYFKKSLWSFFIPIIYSIHTIISAILINRLFLDCPKYQDDPDHKWFKYDIKFQILDILISLGIICLVASWVRNGFMKVLDILNTVQVEKIPYISLLKSIKKFDFTKIPEKNGNITVAFITFMFQRKLKNKFAFILDKYNL